MWLKSQMNKFAKRSHKGPNKRRLTEWKRAKRVGVMTGWAGESFHSIFVPHSRVLSVFLHSERNPFMETCSLFFGVRERLVVGRILLICSLSIAIPPVVPLFLSAFLLLASPCSFSRFFLLSFPFFLLPTFLSFLPSSYSTSILTSHFSRYSLFPLSPSRSSSPLSSSSLHPYTLLRCICLFISRRLHRVFLCSIVAVVS